MAINFSPTPGDMERRRFELIQRPNTTRSRDQAPIDYLAPGTDQHNFVRQYLWDRIRYSERRMQQFHSRWRANELQLQAYISLPDYDQVLKDINDNGGPGQPVAINVPFTWATQNTIITYLIHLFGGRKPIFDVASYRAEQVSRAQNMELLLQYNSDYQKFLRTLYFWLQDGETYGIAAMRTMFRQEKKTRELIVPPDPEMQELAASFGVQAQGTRQRQSYISFEGNDCVNIDPFMFYPDPRVPMYEVNTKGEYVFWRAYEGRHMLLREQAAGRLKWVDRVQQDFTRMDDTYSGGSNRSARSLGDPNPGYDREGITSQTISTNYQVDQGSIEIIPYELGLGESRLPEKWIFTILNGSQIVQAAPLTTMHGKHPVEVAEPNSPGYSFGSLSTVDMLGPMQNLMSWFMNSHIYNVRASLNNLLVVDPTKVEMQDLSNPLPGGVIRLKNTAFGPTDPRTAVSQLAIADVTRSHVGDFQLIGKMASDLTGATDNVRGLQDYSGRKTATEVRTAAEGGSSRLAAKGIIYSSMGLTGLAQQWTYNYQQYLTQDFEIQVLGRAGVEASVRINPDSIQGDFFFPVTDGTLPIDKAGLLDVWRQIFQGVLTDPTGILKQNFSIVEMFKFLCQLGGAQNISNFQLNQASPGVLQQGAAAGNQVPMQDAARQMMGAMQNRGGGQPTGQPGPGGAPPQPAGAPQIPGPVVNSTMR